MNRTHGDHWAHAALLELESVVVASGSRGMRNVEVGRSLGIYHGYPKDGGGEEHRGRIPILFGEWRGFRCGCARGTLRLSEMQGS